MPFPALRDFAAQMAQIIDGLFVASVDEGRLPEVTEPDVSIINQSEMVAAAVDSSFWLVGAPDPVLDRFARTFNEVSEVEPAGTQIRQ